MQPFDTRGIVDTRTELPADLIPLIFSFLNRNTLRECCIVNRFYNAEATRVLYRDLRWTTLRMDARLGGRWMTLVRQIARDQNLASCVKCFPIVAAHRMWKLTSQGMNLLTKAIANMVNLELLEVIGIDRYSRAEFERWTAGLRANSVKSVHMISCIHLAAIEPPTSLPSIRELIFISCSIPRHLGPETLPHIAHLGCAIDDDFLPQFILSNQNHAVPHLIINSAPASSVQAKKAAMSVAKAYLATPGRLIRHLELQTHHGLAIVQGFVEAGAAHVLVGRLSVDPAKCGPLQVPMVFRCLPLLPALQHVLFTRTKRDHVGLGGAFLDAELFENAVRAVLPQIIQNKTSLQRVELQNTLSLDRRVNSNGMVTFVSTSLI